MNVDSWMEAGALVLLATVFVFGKYLGVSPSGHSRRWLSASAGASVAYVFVRALPELSEAQHMFTRVTYDRGLPFAEYRVCTAALIGFLLFYSLENMVSRSGEAGRAAEGEASRLAYNLKLTGFAGYAALIGYLIVHQRGLPTILYLVAMALHFLGVDHSLRRENGAPYDNSGRWMLAAAILIGGATGMVTSMPEAMLAIMLGLNSGGVIINSMIMELPQEKQGRLWPFCAGAIAYTLLLLLT